MGRLLTITNSNTTQLGVKKRTVKSELKIGPVSLTFIAIIIVCVLALFYLSQSNQAAIKGYEIKKLEDKQAQLISEKEQLDVEVASLKSIKQIENNSEINNMVPSKQLNYWPATTVAAK
jgi:cell division protein FtsL